MQHYYTAKTFKQGKFDIVVGWDYETLSIRNCFEETEAEYLRMEQRCEQGTDTHYMVRVQAKYQGQVLADTYLGSCYASGCSVEQDIEQGLGGYLADMVNEAVEEATKVAIELREQLAADFA
jgi:hypothetical protein